MRISNWRPAPGENLKRIEAIDLFKFFVLLLMIQGHLFRAYLLPEIRKTAWWNIHEILHGVVAPGFLFSAGFAAFLAFAKKKEHYLTIGKPFWKRLRRILFLVWCGYWIHFPYLSLRKALSGFVDGSVPAAMAVDILQCIGVSLIIFLLLGLILRKDLLVAAFSLGLAMLFFLLPLTVQDIGGHFAFRAYFDYRISLFPLFPWAGYLFTGIVVAYVYLHLRIDLFFRLLAVAGTLMFPWVFLTKPQFWKLEMTWQGTCQKLGCVFLLLALSYFVVSRWKNKGIDLLKEAGSESLYVYILQNFIIFGSLYGQGMRPRFQDSLGVVVATGLFLLVQAVIFATAIVYGRIKKNRPLLWRIGFVVFWLGFSLYILFRPH